MSNEATKIDWNCSITKRHIREAKAVGLTLLGPGKDRNSRSYRFNSCSHIREFAPRNVNKGEFECKACTELKNKKVATAFGLTLVGPGKDHKYRTYRIDKCKHIAQFQVGHVKENNFRCSRCLDIKLSKEAKVQNLSLLDSRFEISLHYKFQN